MCLAACGSREKTAVGRRNRSRCIDLIDARALLDADLEDSEFLTHAPRSALAEGVEELGAIENHATFDQVNLVCGHNDSI